MALGPAGPFTEGCSLCVQSHVTGCVGLSMYRAYVYLATICEAGLGCQGLSPCRTIFTNCVLLGKIACLRTLVHSIGEYMLVLAVSYK
jgi:hypothetical protein